MSKSHRQKTHYLESIIQSINFLVLTLS